MAWATDERPLTNGCPVSRHVGLLKVAPSQRCPDSRHLISRRSDRRPRDGRRGAQGAGHWMAGGNPARRKQESKPWANHMFVIVNPHSVLANSIVSAAE